MFTLRTDHCNLKQTTKDLLRGLSEEVDKNINQVAGLPVIYTVKIQYHRSSVYILILSFPATISLNMTVLLFNNICSLTSDY